MTKTELKKLATIAYGPDWKSALAKKTKISREQLWRYGKGNTAISDDVAARLTKAIKAQMESQLVTLKERATAIQGALKALA